MFTTNHSARRSLQVKVLGPMVILATSAAVLFSFDGGVGDGPAAVTSIASVPVTVPTSSTVTTIAVSPAVQVPVETVQVPTTSSVASEAPQSLDLPTAAPAEVGPVAAVSPEPEPAEQAAPVVVAPVVVPKPEVVAVPVAVPDLITGRPMYATASVNLRDAAGTVGTTVISGLNARQQVSAGETVDGWIPVHAGDVYGWVSANYLADGTPPAEVTAPAAVAEPAAASDDGDGGNWMTDLVGQVDPNGYATWVFQRNHAWGASDGHTNYIDPDVPADKRFSVMVHEYSHVLQVRVYGSLRNSVAAMSAIVGDSSTDVSANESTADCMAQLLGATWVNYGCQDALRSAAEAILAGHAA